MIFKKPYGFLIRHFKLIHIILTLLTIYIAIRSGTVLSFFRDYVSNGYRVTVYESIAPDTVRPLLFVVIILVITTLITMFILLKNKNKPNKFYLFAVLYYIILLVGLILAYILINGLNEALWETASARSFRDIAQIFYYPQFIFIIILAIRALGFNVKQFDFQKDMIEITDEDSAEVELNINFQTYKAKRTLHRIIRELYYYFLENKFILFIIGGILIAVLIFTIVNKYEKVSYTYNENNQFTYNGFTINIENSILTDIDMAGNSIYDNYNYLVIKFSITNNTHDRKKLDYTSLKLYIGNNYVTPTLDIGKYFVDYGYPYMNYEIDPGSTRTFIMPYLLNTDQIRNNYDIIIYNGQAVKSDKSRTITVKLNPTQLMGVDIVRNAGLNENVSFSSTMLGNTSLNITNVDFTNRYEYQYEQCYNETCNTYNGLVLVQSTSSVQETLMLLDYEFILDNTTESYKNIQNIKTFMNTFATLEYTVGSRTYKSTISDVTPNVLNENRLVLQIPAAASTADSLNLLITIRNRCYVIKLI